jgi:hypothetical protein
LSRIRIGTKDSIVELSDGDRVLKKNSIDYLKDQSEKEYEVWNIKHFFKGNIDEIRAQLESLDVYEKAFLFSVVTYIGYDDCCLKHDNGICVDFDDLGKISRISRGKLSATINSLRKKDIIYKGLNSNGLQYFMNPWLFYKGTKIAAVLKTMFRNYKVRICGDKKWGEMKCQD